MAMVDANGLHGERWASLFVFGGGIGGPHPPDELPDWYLPEVDQGSQNLHAAEAARKAADEAAQKDDPKNLQLVPVTDDGKDKNWLREIVYKVKISTGDPNSKGKDPKETWYVTEHQTNKALAPPDGKSGGNDPSTFDDLLGGIGVRGAQSTQTFTVSRTPGEDGQPSFQVPVHVPGVGDYLRLGLWIDSGGNRVNGDLHWPGVPDP